MLTSLSIRNVVLIEKLDLDFQKGLYVFTGETGAGKSILLDSLSLTLGARADCGLVRHGSQGLTVTAGFSVLALHPVHRILKEHDIDGTEEIILKRMVSLDGKSKAFINDEPVSAGLLKSIGEALVEIHGQFASHHLLNPATHLGVLDSYGALSVDVEACHLAYENWQQVNQKKEIAVQALEVARVEEAFIRDSIDELRSLKPKVGEEEVLTQKRAALMNVEKVMTALNAAYQYMSDESEGASVKTEQALFQLEKASGLCGDGFPNIIASVSQAQQALAEAVGELENATAEIGSEEDLSRVDDRLFALKDIARKHHVVVDELPNLLESMEQKIGSLEHGLDEIVALEKAAEEARLGYKKHAEILSQKRKKIALELDKKVAQELPDLKLSKAAFKTEIKTLDIEGGTGKGINQVTFLVSTNTGVPFAPIHKIASGGELARFMLALKVNLAAVEDIVTLVFDEVDTGIGGATADAVGQRLSRLAEERQVLVVTHSPQVAAYGQHHMVVGKKDKGNLVVTEVETVSEESRLMEVARMLSGAEVTQSGRQMAQELLNKSKK